MLLLFGLAQSQIVTPASQDAYTITNDCNGLFFLFFVFVFLGICLCGLSSASCDFRFVFDCFSAHTITFAG